MDKPKMRFYLFLLCILIFCGCDNNASKNTLAQSSAQVYGTRAFTPIILEPTADGTDYKNSDEAQIDYSNSNKGYIMALYSGENQKVKLQIKTPDNLTYTYTMHKENGLETFALTGGNGTYTVNIFENISGTQYANILSVQVEVNLENEFYPYLYPNQYVNFNKNTKLIAKGEELAKTVSSDIELVEKVYNYTLEAIEYDYDRAETVQSGYTPNPDDVIANKKGICFDYTAVIATLLRTQGIPTRLEVGYAGDVYHAWVSVYIKDIGWINGIIQFDGTKWKRMDPTFADNEKQSKDIMNFISENSNYQTKFKY